MNLNTWRYGDLETVERELLEASPEELDRADLCALVLNLLCRIKALEAKAEEAAHVRD